MMRVALHSLNLFLHSFALVVEYVLRLWSCGDGFTARRKFILAPANIVDLVAFLPFYVTGAALLRFLVAFVPTTACAVGPSAGFLETPLFAAPEMQSPDGGGGAAFVRAMRLLRVFRVFKVGRYSLGIRLFSGALKLSVQPLVILLLSGGVTCVIFASLIWCVVQHSLGIRSAHREESLPRLSERKLKVSHTFGPSSGRLVEQPSSSFVTDALLQQTGRGDMQGMCFGTIPSSAWWVLTTMTTVGYGDCFPITILGKFIAVVAMLSGVIVLALPITVLGSNFAQISEMYEEDAAQFAFQDYDTDGHIDEEELRDFLRSKRREGKLRVDVDTSIASLMAKYDPDQNGYLTMDEFQRLQQDLIIKPRDPIKELREVCGEMQTTAGEHASKTDARLDLLERKLDCLLDGLLAEAHPELYAKAQRAAPLKPKHGHRKADGIDPQPPPPPVSSSAGPSTDEIEKCSA